MLNLSLHKFDELDSLLQGLQYVELNNPSECYYWANPTLEAKCEKVNYDFSQPYPFLVRCKTSLAIRFFFNLDFAHLLVVFCTRLAENF